MLSPNASTNQVATTSPETPEVESGTKDTFQLSEPSVNAIEGGLLTGGMVATAYTLGQVISPEAGIAASMLVGEGSLRNRLPNILRLL